MRLNKAPEKKLKELVFWTFWVTSHKLHWQNRTQASF